MRYVFDGPALRDVGLLQTVLRLQISKFGGNLNSATSYRLLETQLNQHFVDGFHLEHFQRWKRHIYIIIL